MLMTARVLSTWRCRGGRHSRGRGVVRVALALTVMLAAEPAAASGFFVSADGDFLSADHAVRKCPAPYVETEEGRLPLERVASSRKLDVSLLRAKRGNPAFAYFPMRPSASLRGPLIMVRRRAGDDELRVVHARFAGYAENLGDKLVVRAERPIIVGDSGSPLVDAEGALVGMMVAKAVKENTIGIAVDTFTLVDFLAEAGVSIETVEPAARPDGHERESPEAIAGRFTYAVGCLAALEDAAQLRTPASPPQ